MEVMCDVRPLSAANAVGQTLNVEVKGYIQCKKSDLRQWQEWIHARWTLLRGRLRRDPDYAQSHSPGSEWERIYTFGNAGRITAGISAKMKASITPSLSPSLAPSLAAQNIISAPYSLPLSHCERAGASAQPSRAPPAKLCRCRID